MILHAPCNACAPRYPLLRPRRPNGTGQPAPLSRREARNVGERRKGEAKAQGLGRPSTEKDTPFHLSGHGPGERKAGPKPRPSPAGCCAARDSETLEPFALLRRGTLWPEPEAHSLTFPIQKSIPRLRAGSLLLNGCWQEILLHTPVFQQVQCFGLLARIAATATQICSQGGVNPGICQNGILAPLLALPREGSEKVSLGISLHD